MKDTANWQKVLIFLNDNKKKGFADNIFELEKLFSIVEKRCGCPEDSGNDNGRCKKCNLKMKT